jgi:hypothetical protein
MADRLITESIGPVSRDLMATGAIERWFFIRYLDPDVLEAYRHLGRGWQARCQVIDLDTPGYADPAALSEAIRRTLVGITPVPGTPAAGTPFASCLPALLEHVTAAIAGAAGHSFFVARILAATQAAQAALPDPGDPAWRASLPRAAGPAMRRDLDLRLGERAGQAVNLLLPLAYAQGGGLPWEDVWPLLANALAPGHATP